MEFTTKSIFYKRVVARLLLYTYLFDYIVIPIKFQSQAVEIRVVSAENRIPQFTSFLEFSGAERSKVVHQIRKNPENGIPVVFQYST